MKAKKELKDSYKEKKFKIGVFQIRNKGNNKTYFRNRLQLNNELHPNINLSKNGMNLYTTVSNTRN